MSTPVTNPGIILDPVQAVKVEALATGQRMMRDRIAVDLATFATSHPTRSSPTSCGLSSTTFGG